MAYFLKKSNLKKGTYLQIYESFYNPEKKQTAHKSYKAIGYVNELKASGIDDPVAFYSEKVKKLNQEFREKKAAGKKQTNLRGISGKTFGLLSVKKFE